VLAQRHLQYVTGFRLRVGVGSPMAMSLSEIRVVRRVFDEYSSPEW
jgi:hypothetical protein